MSKISEMITQIEAEQASRNNKLIEREAAVTAKEKELKAKIKELAELEGDLEASIEKNEVLVRELRASGKMDAKEEELVGESTAIIEGKRKNRAWENKLARIESNQEKERERLAEYSSLLEKEKADYKETLKEEFFKKLESAVK